MRRPRRRGASGVLGQRRSRARQGPTSVCAETSFEEFDELVISKGMASVSVEAKAHFGSATGCCFGCRFGLDNCPGRSLPSELGPGRDQPTDNKNQHSQRFGRRSILTRFLAQPGRRGHRSQQYGGLDRQRQPGRRAWLHAESHRVRQRQILCQPLAFSRRPFQLHVHDSWDVLLSLRHPCVDERDDHREGNRDFDRHLNLDNNYDQHDINHINHIDNTNHA